MEPRIAQKAWWADHTYLQPTRIKSSLLAGAIAGALVLTACSGSANSDELRRLAGTNAPQVQVTEIPSPQPTETPDFSDAAPTPQTQPIFIKVTRQVVITQPLQVTRVIEVVITPSPLPAPEMLSVVDESVQPCPARYWRRGRCIATSAQIDAYTQERSVQP